MPTCRPLALLAAAALLVPAAALAGGPYEPELTIPTPDSKLINPDRLVLAGVKLGQGKKRVQREWGPAECTNKGCLWKDRDKALGSGIVLFKKGNTVAATIFAGAKGGKPVYKGPILKIKTRKGIGLGSTVGELKKAYPDVEKGPGGFYLGPQGPPFSFFQVAGRKISAIMINKG